MREFIDRHGVGRWALNFSLILLVFGLLYWLQAGSAEANRDTRYDFCVETEQVRRYARDAATRALSTLPTLNYYREHPDELKVALKDVRLQLDYFSPPLDCNEFADS